MLLDKSGRYSIIIAREGVKTRCYALKTGEKGENMSNHFPKNLGDVSQCENCDEFFDHEPVEYGPKQFCCEDCMRDFLDQVYDDYGDHDYSMNF